MLARRLVPISTCGRPDTSDLNRLLTTRIGRAACVAKRRPMACESPSGSRHPPYGKLLLAVGTMTAMLAGCVTLPREPAVPSSAIDDAVTVEAPNSRYLPGRNLSPMLQGAIESNRRERDALLRAGDPVDTMPPAHLLAISGGGDSGAFGAGLLVG